MKKDNRRFEIDSFVNTYVWIASVALFITVLFLALVSAGCNEPNGVGDEASIGDGYGGGRTEIIRTELFSVISIEDEYVELVDSEKNICYAEDDEESLLGLNLEIDKIVVITYTGKDRQSDGRYKLDIKWAEEWDKFKNTDIGGTVR